MQYRAGFYVLVLVVGVLAASGLGFLSADSHRGHGQAVASAQGSTPESNPRDPQPNQPRRPEGTQPDNSVDNGDGDNYYYDNGGPDNDGGPFEPQCISNGVARRLFVTVGTGRANNGVLEVSFYASTETTATEYYYLSAVYGTARMDARLSQKNISRQVVTEAKLLLRERCGVDFDTETNVVFFGGLSSRTR